MEDEFGNHSRGTLRYGADSEGIDFDNGQLAPELDALTAKSCSSRGDSPATIPAMAMNLAACF